MVRQGFIVLPNKVTALDPISQVKLILQGGLVVSALGFSGNVPLGSSVIRGEKGNGILTSFPTPGSLNRLSSTEVPKRAPTLKEPVKRPTESSIHDIPEQPGQQDVEIKSINPGAISQSDVALSPWVWLVAAFIISLVSGVLLVVLRK